MQESVVMDSFKMLHVLLVEDDEIIREMMKKTLERSVGSVYEAGNGLEALELIKAHPVNLVLSDISMPEMDGLELAKRLREGEYDLMVVLITAHSDTSFLTRAIEIGVDQYMIKPILPSQLMEVLSKCVDILKMKNFKAEQEKLEIQRTLHQSKAALLQDISHHWKNPLNAVNVTLAMLEDSLMLDEEMDKEKMLGAIHRVMDVSQQLAHTIDQFNTIFKSEAHIGIHSVQELISQAMKEYVPSVLPETVHYTFKDESARAEIYGCAENFQTLVYQIVKNCVEFGRNKHDEACLDISVTQDSEELTIRFKDHGNGFDDSVVDHAFDPYVSTKEQGHGYGLGLFFVHKIIQNELHGSARLGNWEEGAFVELRMPIPSKTTK